MRTQWVFYNKCGCPRGVLEGDAAGDVEAAWREYFDEGHRTRTSNAIVAAVAAGVTVQQITHDEYERDVRPRMLSDWVCPHAPAGAVA